jgi:hypothetical protein
MGRGSGSDEVVFLERSHDYSPDWDYSVLEQSTETSQRIESLARNMKEQIKANILPELALFGDYEIHFVEEGDLGEDAMARYVNGTYSYPVIVIDAEALTSSCLKYDVPLEVGVATTILHELAHARQDALGEEMDEEEAEDFARVNLERVL